MKIIYTGDSWVYGSEINDPEQVGKWKNPYEFNLTNENREYRLKNNFSYHLSNLLECSNYVNLAWPADDNKTIYTRLLNYLYNIDYDDDIFVVVGFSSPERNSFWYKDGEGNSLNFRINPYDDNLYTSTQRDIWKLYISYLWNEEEYIPNYFNMILNLQSIFKQNNIKWLFFNSFYRCDVNFMDWGSIDMNELSETIGKRMHMYHIDEVVGGVIHKYNKSFDFSRIWDGIEFPNFYKKNIVNNTFKDFIDQSDLANKWCGIHPSESAHELWAVELYNYIKDNSIL